MLLDDKIWNWALMKMQKTFWEEEGELENAFEGMYLGKIIRSEGIIFKRG